MKLVTFQSQEALSVLQKTGILTADLSYIDLKKYGVPYDWMVGEMKKHQMMPQKGEIYPLWAWAKCGASLAPKKRKKRDAVMSKHVVKITFEKSDKDVLLSDYMAYSFILNGQIVPKNKKEYTAFLKQMENGGISLADLKNSVRHQKVKSDIPTSEIQKSWERIFSLKSYIWQACVWNIRAEDVKKVEILDDSNYVYGSMNAKRLDGTRPDWKKKYLKFLS